MTLRRTRLSLFYVAGYLLAGGAGMLLAPQGTLSLLFSTGAYDLAVVRVAGALSLTFGILIALLVGFRAEKFYAATAGLGLLLLAALAVLYLLTTDPLMLVLFAVIALGVAATLGSLLLDREERGRWSNED